MGVLGPIMSSSPYLRSALGGGTLGKKLSIVVIYFIILEGFPISALNCFESQRK